MKPARATSAHRCTQQDAGNANRARQPAGQITVTRLILRIFPASSIRLPSQRSQPLCPRAAAGSCSNFNQQIQPHGEVTMSASTNSLVAKAKKIRGSRRRTCRASVRRRLRVRSQRAHAASSAAIGAAAPMDDSSVSSLVALDNAVEAVAARVTPAVVNVSVTSRAHCRTNWPTTTAQTPAFRRARIPPEFQWFFRARRAAVRAMAMAVHEAARAD